MCVWVFIYIIIRIAPLIPSLCQTNRHHFVILSKANIISHTHTIEYIMKRSEIKGVCQFMPKNAPMSYSNNVLMGDGGALLSKLNRYEQNNTAPLFAKKWPMRELFFIRRGCQL